MNTMPNRRGDGGHVHPPLTKMSTLGDGFKIIPPIDDEKSDPLRVAVSERRVDMSTVPHTPLDATA